MKRVKFNLEVRDRVYPYGAESYRVKDTEDINRVLALALADTLPLQPGDKIVIVELPYRQTKESNGNE